MKKIFLLAITIFIITNLFAQEVSRTTILGYWKGRTVPTLTKNTSTWDSFWNMADDGHPMSGQVVVTSKTGVVTPFYSAVNSDSSRWASIVSAIATMTEGDQIDIKAGNYLANSTIALKSYCTYTFHSSVIYSNSNTRTIFSGSTKRGVTINGSATIRGSNVYTGSPSEVGVYLYGCRDSKISGIKFAGFSYRGLELTQGNPSNNQVSLCRFDSCKVGLFVGVREEYDVFSNNIFTYDSVGIVNYGGNNRYVGTNISRCIDAFHLKKGTNDSHGSFTGGCMNHISGISILADSIDNGFQFNNVDFFEESQTNGYIDIRYCGNIVINGGSLDAPIRITGTPTQLIQFNNVLFSGTYAGWSFTAPQRLMVKFKGCQTKTLSYPYNDDFILHEGKVGVNGMVSPVSLFEVVGSNTNSSIKVRGIEIQGNALNNEWIGENVYFNGGFKYRSTGFANQIYFGGASIGDIAFYTAPSGTAGATPTLTNRLEILNSGNVGIGVTVPLSLLHLKAGTATAGSSPLQFSSGTAETIPRAGCMEYNGTNLFFTRSGTTRESIISANAVNSVSPTAPNRTITVVIDGATYYLSAKTTND